MNKNKAKKIRAALRKAGYTPDPDMPGIWEHSNDGYYGYMGTMMQCLNHAIRKGLINGQASDF